MGPWLGRLTLLFLALLQPFSCHARPLALLRLDYDAAKLGSTDRAVLSLPSSLEAVGLEEPVSEACQNRTYTRYVPVQTTDKLREALWEAEPGDLVELLPGTYDRPLGHNLSISERHGTEDERITICGPRSAVITGAGDYIDRPDIFVIDNCTYVTVAGITFVYGYKGIIVERSIDIILDNLRVAYTDQEGGAPALQHYIQYCDDPGNGEGVYIGSNAYTEDAIPDRSDYNQVLYNRIGPRVTAEMVDVKENTQHGLIEGNTFDGSGLTDANFADSWVDIKGNNWTIRGNVGTHTIGDGFQTHDKLPPLSGEYNSFEGNTCNNMTYPSLCVRIACDPGRTLCHNVVTCDNVVAGGNGLLSNLKCTA
ncbi:hypothetical protein N2152v2_002954 [Parachlorella kessleri]